MTPQHDSWTRRRILRGFGFVFAGTHLVGCTNPTGEGPRETATASTRTKTDTEVETTTATTTERASTAGNASRTESENHDPGRVSLRKLGQLRLSRRSARSGGYSEVAVRPNGRYAVVGTKWGTSGTYLVDLSNPAAPSLVHYLPSSNGSPNMDVKVHSRNGLYYRTIERDDDPASFEIVDYGYRSGTPQNPQVISAVEGPDTHNIEPHPTEPVLYTVNYYPDQDETSGFDVYDVRDPAVPRRIGGYGPEGRAHDITIDAERQLCCCAYQGGAYTGYVFFDVSDPRAPAEVGRFDYGDRLNYYEVGIGRPGFDSAHNSAFDPRRELVFVGDERPYGEPGGKHVLDVGWRDGSFSNPIHVGYTLSPNAQYMREDTDGDGDRDFTERFDWTGHHFEVVPYGEATLLVSGDWHEGVVLYDVTDPTNPRPIDRYRTIDGAGTIEPNEEMAELGSPPMAWNAVYNPTRELVVVSDMFTGLYTFELRP